MKAADQIRNFIATMTAMVWNGAVAPVAITICMSKEEGREAFNDFKEGYNLWKELNKSKKDGQCMANTFKPKRQGNNPNVVTARKLIDR